MVPTIDKTSPNEGSLIEYFHERGLRTRVLGSKLFSYAVHQVPLRLEFVTSYLALSVLSQTILDAAVNMPNQLTSADVATAIGLDELHIRSAVQQLRDEDLLERGTLRLLATADGREGYAHIDEDDVRDVQTWFAVWDPLEARASAQPKQSLGYQPDPVEAPVLEGCGPDDLGDVSEEVFPPDTLLAQVREHYPQAHSRAERCTLLGEPQPAWRVVEIFLVSSYDEGTWRPYAVDNGTVLGGVSLRAQDLMEGEYLNSSDFDLPDDLLTEASRDLLLYRLQHEAVEDEEEDQATESPNLMTIRGTGCEAMTMSPPLAVGWPPETPSDDDHEKDQRYVDACVSWYRRLRKWIEPDDLKRSRDEAWAKNRKGQIEEQRVTDGVDAIVRTLNRSVGVDYADKMKLTWVAELPAPNLEGSDFHLDLAVRDLKTLLLLDVEFDGSWPHRHRTESDALREQCLTGRGWYVARIEGDRAIKLSTPKRPYTEGVREDLTALIERHYLAYTAAASALDSDS